MSGYYGGDSCEYTAVTCGGMTFYAKPTGSINTGPACSCSTCLSSGATIYSLWTLKGPGSAPSGTTPTQWGQQQAAVAINEWFGDTDVTGATIFFDVETNSGGWGTDTSSNQAVLEATLAYVANYGQTPGGSNGGEFDSGVYISVGSNDNKWDTYFGSSYKPSTPFVLWAAIHECLSCTDAASQWPNYWSSKPINAGGQEVVIAQYYIGACGGADLDYMIQNPTNGRFSPVSYSG